MSQDKGLCFLQLSQSLLAIFHAGDVCKQIIYIFLINLEYIKSSETIIEKPKNNVYINLGKKKKEKTLLLLGTLKPLLKTHYFSCKSGKNINICIDNIRIYVTYKYNIKIWSYLLRWATYSWRLMFFISSSSCR